MMDSEATPIRNKFHSCCEFHNGDHMTSTTAITRRSFLKTGGVDGIFINRWDGSGMCCCEHCQTHFRKSSGHELPRTGDPHDPAGRAYILWRQQRLFDLWRLWDSEVRSINPDSCVIPNTGGGATSSLDMRRIGELAPLLIADRQARRGLMAPWANGKNGKEFRAAMGRKPIVGIFSVGVEDLYRRYARWGKYLRNEHPLARVGLVYSQQTAWFHDAKVEEHTLGWYQVLVESRIAFEMVHDRLLDGASLEPFKTLILPNVAALSDTQCQQLREFVKRGGSLISTYKTSLYDEWGVKRRDFGLADLFGVRIKAHVEGPMQNSYLRLERDGATGKQQPLLAGLENAPRIINGVRRIEVDANRSFPDPPLTLIPSYPDLPMEKVYPRVLKTDVPQVFLSELSAGRVVYFPWDVDRTFLEVLSVDHLLLLRNAVHWATDEELPVTVTGPGMLDVTIWQQKSSLTVHLVNLSNDRSP